jgi:hypothetical protein
VNSKNSINHSEFTGGQTTYSPLFILARLLESGNESYYKMTRLGKDESQGIIEES